MTSTILRYPGGKARMAEKIVGLFPRHQQFVELFGGGASLLLTKPRVKREIYNDLDREVVNFFQTLREPDSACELANLIALTPWARVEFVGAMAANPDDSPVEKARKFLVRSYMAFSPTAIFYDKSGFRGLDRERGGGPVHLTWLTMPDKIMKVSKRLSGVIIECSPALELLHKLDAADTLVYIDPPYPLSARSGGMYRHEMDDAGHLELVAALLKVKHAMVAVSGYPDTCYDLALSHGHWERIVFPAQAQRPHKGIDSGRCEVVWLNEKCWRAKRTLFSDMDFAITFPNRETGCNATTLHPVSQAV